MRLRYACLAIGCGWLLTFCTVAAESTMDSAQLEAASLSQQKGLACLVAALKDVRQVMLKKGAAKIRQESNPFDKKRHPESDSENAEKALRRALQQQQEVLKNLEGDGGGANGPSEAAKSGQGQVSAAIRQLLDRAEFSPAVKEMLENAGRSSSLAEQALQSLEASFAQENARRSSSALEQALDQLSGERQEKAEAALRDARMKINDEMRKEKNGEGSAESAGAAAGEVAEGIGGLAEDEQQNGMAQRADALRKLAARAKETAGQLQNASDSAGRMAALQGLSEQLDQQRGSGGNSGRSIQQNAEKLRALEKEFRFYEKHPGAGAAPGSSTLPSETELTMQDLIRQLQAQNPEYRFTPPGTDKSGDPAGMGYLLRDPAAIIPRRGNLAYEELITHIGALLEDVVRIKMPHPRPEVIQFAPEEVPAEYRNAVGDYFKGLSEDSSHAQ